MWCQIKEPEDKGFYCILRRDNGKHVINIVTTDISISLTKQYSLLSFVNTRIKVSKYQKKKENGHLALILLVPNLANTKSCQKSEK